MEGGWNAAGGLMEGGRRADRWRMDGGWKEHGGGMEAGGGGMEVGWKADGWRMEGGCRMDDWWMEGRWRVVASSELSPLPNDLQELQGACSILSQCLPGASETSWLHGPRCINSPSLRLPR